MITVVGPFVRVRRASIYRPNSYERVQLHLSDVTRLNSFDFLWLKCLYKIKISSLISNFFVILAYVYLLFIKWTVSVITAINVSTVELHLSGLIWTASHRDMQKIRIIGFVFENRLHWEFEVRPLWYTVCTRVKTFRPHLIWSSRSHNTVLYLIR